MFPSVFAIHPGLQLSGRLPALARQERGLAAAEFAVLFLLGIAAATLSSLLKLNLGIPGHNIIRVIFPMALGLAVVPRRGSGSVMGLGGLVGAVGFSMGGIAGLGAGAATSLVLTGFFLDAALLGARPGKSVYLRLTVAGLTANMAAFLIKVAEKSFFVGGLEGGPVAVWWPKAIVTYSVCGLLAGILSAVVWFRFSVPNEADPTQ
jgi:hypothetical protein